MARHLVAKLQQFVRLSEDDVSMLDRVMAARVRRLSAHEDVICEGDKPRHVNVVLSGWACRYKQLEDGRRQIIAFFVPGDMCDLNVFILREMDHSLAALTPVTLAEVTREEFDEVASGHPRVVQALLWDTLVAAATQREWTVNLGQRVAAERLGHLLCELFIRLHSVGLTEGNSCELPLTQSQLGEAMGLSSVHVNRTLQELRVAGLIVLKDKTLTIPDLEALKSASLFNSNYLHLGHEGAYLDANSAAR